MELTAPLRTPPRKNARDGCGRARSEQSATSATRSARWGWRRVSPGREPPAIAPPARLLVPRGASSGLRSLLRTPSRRTSSESSFPPTHPNPSYP